VYQHHLFLCKNTGSSQGWNYIGNAKWIDYQKSGVRCMYRAQATFNTLSYTCDPLKFPLSADSVCRNINYYNNKYYSSPAAYWTPGTLSENKCKNAAAYGSFDSNPCEGAEGRSDYWNNVENGGRRWGCSGHSEFHPFFYYKPTTDTCSAGPDTWECNGNNFEVIGTASPRGYNAGNTSFQFCGSREFEASQIAGPSSDKDCGWSSYYPAFESKSFTPAQHAYRRLDFGTGQIDGETKRIQLSAGSVFGPSTSTSTLNVSNAGIRAGVISPASNPIKLGAACSEGELGKISQEQVNDTFGASGGQLQCTYNVVYCSKHPYYCFLPTKNITLNFQFKFIQYSYTCPVGTIVDSNQSVNAVVNNNDLCVPPPPPSDQRCFWVISKGPYGGMSNCNPIPNQLDACHTYQTQCEYKNSCNPAEVKITPAQALLYTKCSANPGYFTINNYKNPGK
jgi:hypothetical protein